MGKPSYDVIDDKSFDFKRLDQKNNVKKNKLSLTKIFLVTLNE